MKVDVSQVVIDHFRTLRNDASGRQSISDIVIFYLVPVLLAASVYISRACVSQEFYNISVTFFGIFVALLLNLQVAAFGIYNRRWNTSSDDRSAEIQATLTETRRIILRELNANISYLILISVASISFFLITYTTNWIGRVSSCLSVFVYSHFILTLLMVVKRSHILFRNEYDQA